MGCSKFKKSLRFLLNNKVRRSSGAKHCSSLCSQSEGDEYCGGQARAENPTKSCSRALVMFATCSWPSLCEQSELQCWRRNRRLRGPVQISAARALPLTFDTSILNAQPEKGSTSALAMLFALKKSARFLGQNGMTVAAMFLVPFILALYVVCPFLRC